MINTISENCVGQIEPTKHAVDHLDHQAARVGINFDLQTTEISWTRDLSALKHIAVDWGLIRPMREKVRWLKKQHRSVSPTVEHNHTTL